MGLEEQENDTRRRLFILLFRLVLVRTLLDIASHYDINRCAVRAGYQGCNIRSLILPIIPPRFLESSHTSHPLSPICPLSSVFTHTRTIGKANKPTNHGIFFVVFSSCFAFAFFIRVVNLPLSCIFFDVAILSLSVKSVCLSFACQSVCLLCKRYTPPEEQIGGGEDVRYWPLFAAGRVWTTSSEQQERSKGGRGEGTNEEQIVIGIVFLCLLTMCRSVILVQYAVRGIHTYLHQRSLVMYACEHARSFSKCHLYSNKADTASIYQ